MIRLRHAYYLLFMLILFSGCEPTYLGTIPVMNVQFNNVPTTLNLDHLLFESEQVGFCASSDSNIVFHTTDGGNTWNTITFRGNIKRLFSNQLGDVFINCGTIYRTNFENSELVELMFQQEGAGCTANGNIYTMYYHWGKLECKIYHPKTGQLVKEQEYLGFLDDGVILPNKNCIIFTNDTYFDDFVEIYNVDSNKTRFEYKGTNAVPSFYFDEWDTMAVSHEYIEDLIGYNQYWNTIADTTQYNFKAIHGKNGLFATVGKGCVVSNYYTLSGKWTTIVPDNYTPINLQFLNVQVMSTKLIYVTGEKGTFMKCKL